jgi:hypothetical protein
MGKKILAFAVLFAVALTGVAFANGQKDTAIAGSAAAGTASATGLVVPGTNIPAVTGQKLTLAGALSFQNLIHPTLKVSDKVYELMVPRFLIDQAGLKEGAQVTVEGYEVKDMPMMGRAAAATTTDDGNTDVFVTKATINGKDYDLAQFGGQGMGRGMGRGMMGAGRWRM